LAPLTTWLLVSTKPSGVNTKPEPVPSMRPREPRRPAPPCAARWRTSMLTTAGPTASAA